MNISKRKKIILIVVCGIAILSVILLVALKTSGYGAKMDSNGKGIKDTQIAKEEGKYSIKFDSIGGSLINEQLIEYGKTVQKPEIPIKDKYIFEYWMLDGQEFQFDTNIKNDITLIAKWREVEQDILKSDDSAGTSVVSENKKAIVVSKYTVEFNSNGGTGIASQTVIKNNVATRPETPTKSEYTFVDWMLNDKAYDFSTKVTGNITLVATWKPIIKKPGVPSVSMNVTGAGSTGVQVTINITGVSGAEGYEIYKSSNSGSYELFQRITLSTIGEGSIQTDNVNLGETNSYKVTAFKKDGNNYIYGDFSEVLTKHVDALASPTIAIGGMGGEGDTFGALITISPMDPAEYEIYRSSTENGNYTLIDTVQTPEYSVQIPFGQQYYYKVRAYLTEGAKKLYSGYSNVLHIGSVQ